MEFFGHSLFFVNDDLFTGLDTVRFLTILTADFCMQDAALFL